MIDLGKKQSKGTPVGDNKKEEPSSTEVNEWRPTSGTLRTSTKDAGKKIDIALQNALNAKRAKESPSSPQDPAKKGTPSEKAPQKEKKSFSWGKFFLYCFIGFILYAIFRDKDAPPSEPSPAVVPAPTVVDQTAEDVQKAKNAKKKVPKKAKTFAPSFDCSMASTYVEKTICSDRDLATMDKEMFAIYNRLLPSRGKKVRLPQRAWLSEERNQCQDRDCIKRCYEERIHVLKIEEEEGSISGN